MSHTAQYILSTFTSTLLGPPYCVATSLVYTDSYKVISYVP